MVLSPFWVTHSESLSYEILPPDKIELSTPFMPCSVARFLILLNTVCSKVLYLAKHLCLPPDCVALALLVLVDTASADLVTKRSPDTQSCV